MFVTPNATAPAAQQSAAGSKEKAPRTTGAYVNAYVPLADGTRVKLFSDLTLRLFMEKQAEAKLVALMRSGVLTTEQVASMIKIEVSLARDEAAPIEFDLSQFGL